jgi:hypothetical protein
VSGAIFLYLGCEVFAACVIYLVTVAARKGRSAFIGTLPRVAWTYPHSPVFGEAGADAREGQRHEKHHGRHGERLIPVEAFAVKVLLASG